MAPVSRTVPRRALVDGSPEAERPAPESGPKEYSVADPTTEATTASAIPVRTTSRRLVASVSNRCVAGCPTWSPCPGYSVRCSEDLPGWVGLFSPRPSARVSRFCTYSFWPSRCSLVNFDNFCPKYDAESLISHSRWFLGGAALPWVTSRIRRAGSGGRGGRDQAGGIRRAGMRPLGVRYGAKYGLRASAAYA